MINNNYIIYKTICSTFVLIYPEWEKSQYNIFKILLKKAINKKVSKDKIIWDPGIGFSKDTKQNIEILRNIPLFKKFEFPLLIGASRKRFIGEILNVPNPKERDIGTLAISCLCSQQNIHLVRVHDVKLNYQVLKVADQLFR